MVLGCQPTLSSRLAPTRYERIWTFWWYHDSSSSGEAYILKGEKIKLKFVIQGVAYLHGTKEDPYYTDGGRYIFWPNGPGAEAASLPPKRGQAIIMDGGRMIHGVERTKPGHRVGRLQKGNFNRIEYQGFSFLKLGAWK